MSDPKNHIVKIEGTGYRFIQNKNDSDELIDPGFELICNDNGLEYNRSLFEALIQLDGVSTYHMNRILAILIEIMGDNDAIDSLIEWYKKQEIKGRLKQK